MNEQRAKLLLEETFKNRFDNGNFVQFIKELFNKFEDHQIEFGREEIPKDFQEFIDSCRLFGEYTDSEGKSIDVLAVKLLKNNPEFARTMQRNFIAKYLAQKNADAALVAFYGEEIDNWRFSFVKLEYHLEKNEKGDVKPATNLTPPKRYSFLVGKTEPSHTAQSRFLELLVKEDSNPKVSEIESSFSVEKVTEEFFGRYKELFLELEESLNKIAKQNKELAKEFAEKGISTTDFTKKLLGQIVFIYFLQKKGWLGIEKDEAGRFREWGTGHKDFLKKLYHKDMINYNNFFNDILEPLFYEALARDRENDYYPLFKCKIPFLNGGLFEPLGGYDWTNTDILIDNKIFGKIIETFDLYNFTVKEDEPLEKEVAIDPEMLGKVFENLLEIKDRKSKGSYYTPREIVYYMCQESLINYLETKTRIDQKDVEDFIYTGEISGQIKDNREKIDKLLKDIKVVDPAIGSGAFPVGMMMEIIKARGSLTKFFPKEAQSERTAYNFKRECIEDSLYGVDIDPGAVDIAQLRLWLSLIVDEADIHKIKPLPNLDYKIMCGNSLLDEFEGVKLFDERLLGKTKNEGSLEVKNIEERTKELYQEFGEIQIGKKKDNGRSKEIKKEITKLKRKKQELMAEPKKELIYGNLFGDNKIKESQKKLNEIKELHRQYFNENNRRDKLRLREEIEKRDWEFIEETLTEQGNEEAIKKLKQIKKTRSKPFFLWKLYFSEVFQEKGGFDVVIANPPYRILTKNNTDNAELKNYISLFNSIKYSPSKNIFTLFIEQGIMLTNSSGVLTYIVPEGLFTTRSYSNCVAEINKAGSVRTIATFTNFVFENAVTGNLIFCFTKNRVINTQKYHFDSEYKIHLVHEEVNPIITKIFNKNTKPLKEICMVFKGMVVKDRETVIYEDAKQGKDIFLLGKSISKWAIVKKYYTNYNKLEIIGGTKKLQKHGHFPRILIRRTGDTLCCTLLNQPALTESTLYSCWAITNGISDKFLLGLLNSRLFDYYIKKTLITNKQAFPQILMTDLENVPLLIVAIREQQPFIRLVDQILSITKDSDYLNNQGEQENVKKLENELNQLVYTLYKLTPKEIELVEDFYKKKRG